MRSMYKTHEVMAMRRCVGEALLERDYFNPIAFTRISYEECHYMECIHYVECIAFDLLYTTISNLSLIRGSTN